MAARRLQSVYLHDNLLPGVSPALFSSQNYLQFADFSRSGITHWAQRFYACFVLKLAPQRVEGEKRVGVQILELSSQNL